eukprot:3680646-Prymnesium_polylepis.1
MAFRLVRVAHGLPQRGLPQRSLPQFSLPLVRRLSTDAWRVLGLPAGSTRPQIKAAYYEAAKRTHPDGQSSDDADAPAADPVAFLAVQAAFEELMAQQGPSSKAAPATAANHAARSGSAAERPSRSHRAPRASARIRTLGEVLCDRLSDEPEYAPEIWSDIVNRQLAVNAYMTDALFRACAKGGLGMPVALGMLREGTRLGLLTQAVRSASIVSILCHCKEDDLDTTFQLVDEITDEDRTPEVLAA